METACDICGCTESNLVDGFYYCAECGTQDTNVRETLVEVVALGDGAIALGSRRRITQIPKANEEQMTDDWYKWHGLNFLLRGLANDLVGLGAAPSLKTKLLWLWTRYMKEYLNKADFGLTSDQQEEKAQEEQNLDNDDDGGNIEDENFINDEDIFGLEENDLRQHKKDLYKVNIKRINMPLLLTFLYVALNLDKSHIQLTHLIRFVREGRLDVLHWQKHVPKELNPKKLFYCLLFSKQWIKYSYSTILQLAFQLFKELDLGNPIVPDMRLLVDEYMKELCLPNDMKPLVLSLMHFRSFDYLDMNVKFYDSGRIPSYELYVISHILCAMKICFGIDGAYENELSDSVDKINIMEGHSKSYNSEPTKRLFSFREWCKYIQFRKSMLWANSLYLGAPNYCDMDDFVAFEHLGERPDYKKTYKDEIARNIISKLPDVEINVIPKSEFPATTTAHTCYTRVIIDHVQDPNIKQLLSEDFSQYSLKYITEDMFLVDPDSIDPKNIISGGKGSHLIELGKDFSALKGFATTKFDQKTVYVKDCDNHNWVTTERPKLEHVTEVLNNDESATQETSVCSEEPHNLSVTNASSQVEKIESELKENSNLTEYKDNTILIEDSKVFNDSKIEIEIDKSHIEFEVNKEKLKEENLKISEEDEDVNIFDDNFAYLDAKKEDEFVDTEPPNETLEPEHGLSHNNEAFPIPDLSNHNLSTQEYRDNERDSDASSIDSLHFTAETLDRAAVIKELVVHACQKYKISLNGQYINQPRKKNYVRKKTTENVERVKVRGSTKKKIQGLIDEYYNQVQQDIFLEMSNMVQSAITDFNASRGDEPMDIDVPIIDNNNTSGIGDQNENEPNMETLNDSAMIKSVLDEADNHSSYKIFDEESDGETQAEELLPKRNPDFDEATHNTSQLFIKTAEDTTAPELRLHPQLFSIIDEKLNENTDFNSISTPKTEVNSDSEEDVSLSMLQELKQLREQLTRQQKCTKERKLPQLIKSSVPPYNYWLKHYSKGQHLSGLQRTVTEIDNSFPASFKLVLFECADMVGYPVHWVYNSLQRVERCIKHKYVRKRRLVPSYFEKEQKRFMQSKDLL